MTFNPEKSQLICFENNWCSSITNYPVIVFLDKPLQFSTAVTHLGHTLSVNLSDSIDVSRARIDFCRKANFVLHTFNNCDVYTKTTLLLSHCLSFYGCPLWIINCKELDALQVCINNVIRRVWMLPRRCHTSILYLVSVFPPVRNIIYDRSLKLLRTALVSPSITVRDVFRKVFSAVSSIGFNCLFGSRFTKSFSEDDILISRFIQEVRMSPRENQNLEDDVLYLCQT